ncbi:MAG: sensor domain-containing diguanylate cyclase [Lachnospiraceae bacterium]|nr:sensor domain-containing diguanylate cyclase [Lachnospiraceae bacterium]
MRVVENNGAQMLTKIYDICDKVYKGMSGGAAGDHSEVFAYLTELGKILAGADRASFWKWDKRRKELWTTSATGVDRIVIPDSSGLVGKALREKRVVVTNDPYSDPDFNSAVDKQTGYVTRSVLVMPVSDVNGECIGAFQIINKLDGGFDAEKDVRRLSLAAIICGIALESETFKEASMHDKLTGLKNRMGFYSDFSRKYSRLVKEGRPLSMFIADIDKFKRVNDTYGHNAGDVVLAFMSALVESFARIDDGVYRWGGEEFIMLMPDTDLDGAVAMAEKIRAKLEASPCEAEGNIINLTASFGCCRFDPEKTIEENVSVADGHLYTAKETGRNRVIY